MIIAFRVNACYQWLAQWTGKKSKFSLHFDRVAKNNAMICNQTKGGCTLVLMPPSQALGFQILSVALFQFDVQWSWEAIGNKKFLGQNFIFDLHIKENENSMKLNTIDMSLLIKEITFSSWESEQRKTWILIGKAEDVHGEWFFQFCYFWRTVMTLYRKRSLRLIFLFLNTTRHKTNQQTYFLICSFSFRYKSVLLFIPVL